ncbi:calcium-binding protein [Pectobacterium brasiliense]|uniref:calcium-binding protein n=1 Tax=Pectobacterium brasiliense TaxID=180957 RepID=UPI002A80860D|nr:calcium-binding protein [Pectobacterium brasiliense]MDY4367377.1 calcium-binding protein [Pectobacterium brasiliense]MDY7056908.1 calcium-binding protein [Pectobacterium brasiliense]
MLRVPQGQITFDGEGNDIPGSPFFSRVIHWPGKTKSGVTLGRGYDMGKRTKGEIYSDMLRVCIGSEKASLIATGAGLKGGAAATFVKMYKEKIGVITHQQQMELFNIIYVGYIEIAKKRYARYSTNVPDRADWAELHPAIRDILVDLAYQGFAGETTIPVAAKNDIDLLIKKIESTKELLDFEEGRKLADYLRMKK